MYVFGCCASFDQKKQSSQVSEGENVVPILLELHQLRVLDISDEKDAHPFEMFHPTRTCIAEFLKSEGCMMHLTFLDISGESRVTVLLPFMLSCLSA